MPHKHTRRKGDDESNFDLAPSAVARPLAAYDPQSKQRQKQKQNQKQKNFTNKPKPTPQNGYKHDDTPRAFARMMALQTSKKRQRSGLDDGNQTRASKKKRKSEDADDNTAQTQTKPAAQENTQSEIPKIQPGERLADFAARVNHALPVGNLARKGKIKVDGMKERQTKTEKRLHKMYASWREEEAKLKEKEDERREQEEEMEDEREAEMGGQRIEMPASSSRKGKRRKMVGEQAGGDDEDPWAQLKTKREAPKGLHDVVQAPPSFKAVPKEKFKVKNGAKVNVENIPTAVGSLKKREELNDARKEVIERYRAMMKK